MSILGFLIKRKKEMRKENTKKVRVGKYTITSHAQNRIVDITRKMTKYDVLDNLFTNSNGITEIKYDINNRPSYERVGKYITTVINPNNNNVVSCRPVSKKDKRDFHLSNIKKKGKKKKYVKQKYKNKY